MIEAKIIKDSISDSNVRITTYVLTYPRFIHSEFMTHRVFSRNASSSRAIPVKKQIKMARENPAVPLAFTKNQKGMQGGEILNGEDHRLAEISWLGARDYACRYAEQLEALEVHKQYANRILEPFLHISVVCTSTDYNNFFALRTHQDAQPEFRELASRMYELYLSNQPVHLETGMWHLPFIDDHGSIVEYMSLLPKGLSFLDCQIRQSVARCARVSYNCHDGNKSTLEKDLDLYNRLVGGSPIHASPAEHQAMAVPDSNVRSGNFRGWIQYRKTLFNENIQKFVPNISNEVE